MFRSLILLLICAVMEGAPLSVDVEASSAILINAKTGAVLFEKHAHLPAYPASTTKVATALFTLDAKRAPLTSLFTVPKEALKLKVKGAEQPFHLEEGGSMMKLVAGETLSLEALLHGLLLVSGNDAANVIAASLAPSIPHFVEEMNGYLHSIGCRSTRFVNPHGLHHPDHVTTAYDLSLMAKKALEFPELKEIVSKVSYAVPKTNKQGKKELRQTNPLLKPGPFYYPYAMGMKTGYTSQALYALIAAAEQGERTLIAVLLGCKKRSDRYEDAIRLFDAAFAEQKERRIVISTAPLFQREVKGGKGPLVASPREEVAIEFFPSEEPTCRAFVSWEVPPFPIAKGQRVGEIRVVGETGEVLATAPLVANGAVKQTFWAYVKSFFE